VCSRPDSGSAQRRSGAGGILGTGRLSGRREARRGIPRPTARQGQVAIAWNVVVHIDGGLVEYAGAGHRAEWGEEVAHERDLRQIVRAHDRQAPVATRDAVLATCDFSDPAIVHIAPPNHGNTMWTADRNPSGSLAVPNVIPASPTAQHRLANIGEGDRVRLTGHEETDSRIENSDGGWVELGRSNHRFVPITGVEVRSPWSAHPFTEAGIRGAALKSVAWRRGSRR